MSPQFARKSLRVMDVMRFACGCAPPVLQSRRNLLNHLEAKMYGFAAKAWKCLIDMQPKRHMHTGEKWVPSSPELGNLTIPVIDFQAYAKKDVMITNTHIP